MRTMVFFKWTLAVGLLWSLSAGAAPVTRAQATTAVSVLPAGGTYAVGQELLVEVWVQNVVDLYGADVQLSFDPARLEVLDSDPGTGGVQVAPSDDLLQPEAVVRREADNEAGTVWYAVTQVGETEPVSGSGVLFSFTVKMLSEGTANLSITNKDLSTIDGDPIPADANSAIYTIGTPYNLYLPLVRRGALP